MKKLLLLLMGLPYLSFSQIQGSVIDFDSKQPVVGAKITTSEGQRVITDYDGRFKLNPAAYPVKLITVMLPYVTDTTSVDGPGDLQIFLREPVQNISTVVVSAGRRSQEVEEVPISMEIIRPGLIDNKGVNDLEQAVDQSPGVFTMDGQVSIRGGSGFAYGAGSRVLVLWNGMPLLSGYAGDTQWNAIPIEQAAQIEIMKGAASVLYGSGALNGVISLQEKEPGIKPETKAKVQFGVYDRPQRESLHWWSKENNSPVRPALGSPMNQQVEFYRGQMYKKMGYTISSTLFHNDGFREGETEYRGRISGTIYYRPQKFKRVKTGIGYNYQVQQTGNFLIWESDSLGYTPSGGADVSDSNSTLTFNRGQRLFIDPYIKIIDKKNNRHNLKARMYFAENANLTNTAQSNGAIIYFAEYQFQRQFSNGINITSGISDIYNVVTSELFGNHRSNNIAAYTQYEQKIGKLDLTGGVRLEHFIMDGRSGDTDFTINKKKGTTIPIYPIFRGAAHYELAKYSHLRASIGQGIRYPSVAERYIETNVGALNIFPNSELSPEIGWAAEIGFKQGLKIGKDWKGLFDVSAFVNEYKNMMEFTFGLYNRQTYQPLNPVSNAGDAAYLNGIVQQFISSGMSPAAATAAAINSLAGFQAQNAEAARITGIELSFNSAGKIGEWEIISLIGYTYMNPISLNNDSSYIYGVSSGTSYVGGFSDTSTRMLKYRFNHLAKADIEANYKKLSFGLSCRYNSFMRNIDGIFEQNIFNTGTYILPGLKGYREVYNKGNLVFDARFGYRVNDNYRVGFMVNNILNSETTSRPGDIQAPRNFIIQLQMKF
jgi:outer membrane receptor protein involved in Fe transport